MSTVKTILVLTKLNAMLTDQLVPLAFHWVTMPRDLAKNLFSQPQECNINVIYLLYPEPIIQFTKERIFVVGPAVAGASREALITVKKTGDPTTRSKVRLYTLDGSAKSGKGYQPVTEVNKIFFD